MSVSLVKDQPVKDPGLIRAARYITDRSRFFGALLVLVVTAIVVAACTSSGSNSQSSKNLRAEQDAQALIDQQLDKNQPLPQIKYSQLRQNLIEIKIAEAQGVQTTTFFFQMGDTDPLYSCPSIGAPIDENDQLSNPNQIVHDGYPNGGEAVVIDQQDPTGEYSTGGGSGGTYTLCLGADGEGHAVYWEGQTMSVFAPAKWVHESDGTGHVELTGPASYDFTESKGHK